VVAEFPLRHSKREWEEWSRGGNPSVTRKTSERGCGGQETPPSRVSSKGGVVVAEFPLRHSKWEWEGWSTWLAAAIVDVGSY